MLQGESSTAGFIFPKHRKLYVWISIVYGFCADNDIRSMFTRPHFHSSIWPWMLWMNIAATAILIWFFFELFSDLSNRIERLICLLSVIYFALGILSYLDALGYRWAHIWGGYQISTALLTVSALLMFWRTFQVFKHREA